MAKKKTKTSRAAGGDEARSRRFYFLWLPIIIVILFGLYALALDPPQPTGRMIKAKIVGKDTTGQPQGPSSQLSQLYKVRLETGGEESVLIPEKDNPQPQKDIVVEELSTRIFQKKTYEYRP